MGGVANAKKVICNAPYSDSERPRYEVEASEQHTQLSRLHPYPHECYRCYRARSFGSLPMRASWTELQRR